MTLPLAGHLTAAHVTPPLAGHLAAALDGLTRDGARSDARRELLRAPYREAQPPLALRVLRFVLDALDELLDAASGLPGGRGGVVLLALLLVGVVVVVLVRLGPLQRGRGRRPDLDTGTRLTAAGHREAAEQAAAEGRYADAVRERLRAVVRELEGRGVLDARPGRTAGEVARDGGAAVPELATDLARAAAVFDAVWYGGRTADAGSYAVLVAVDERATQARVSA